MDISYLTQVIGACGVIASILYLAIQIRQNTKIAQSQTLNALTGRLTERLLLAAENNQLAGLIAKDWDNDELTTAEGSQILFWVSCIIIDLKDIHTQYRLRVIPKSLLLERTQVVKQGIFTTEIGKNVWANVSKACDSKFIAWFEKEVGINQ